MTYPQIVVTALLAALLAWLFMRPRRCPYTWTATRVWRKPNGYESTRKFRYQCTFNRGHAGKHGGNGFNAPESSE